MNMKNKIFILLYLSIMITFGIGTVTAVNFTDWAPYGDAWRANNDSYIRIMWNSSGNHYWLSTGNTTRVTFLLEGGGGGGGGASSNSYSGGGGGGAGGFVNGFYNTSGLISLTVGAGGNGGDNTGAVRSANGTNSTFGTLVAIGGGAGALHSDTVGYPSFRGGSGGGGAGATGGNAAGGAGIQNSSPSGGFGSNGGTGGVGSGVGYSGGGGGGAGGVGATAPGGANTGGAGGTGRTDGVFGLQVGGGGGGGGHSTGGSATFGGGAGGSCNNGANAVNGTGGGGGGGGCASKTGGKGGTGLVVVEYSIFAVTASFTSSANPSFNDTAVQFTDTSIGNPSTWNWSFNGGADWENGTIQNKLHPFTSTGTYNVTMLCNSTDGMSNVVFLNQVVSDPFGFTQQDIYLSGQYNITFLIRDSTTNLPIANATVVDAVSGQSYHTTDGTAYLTEPAGLIYVNFIADGYQSRQITYAIDEDATKTVKLTPSAPSPGNSPVPVYIPQQVRIRLVDFEGDYLSGVMVTATPVNFTAPANWTEILFGISPGVNITGSSVTGITGTDGSWVAPMLQSIQYNVSFTRDPDISYIVTLYPQQSEYVYTIPLGIMPITTPSNIITYSLSNATIDATHQYVNMTYTDSSGGTDYLQFAVFDTNNTMIHSANYTGTAANSQVYSQVVTCPKGTGTSYVINANQSQYGWINQSATIRLDTQVDLMLNGGPEWVKQWVAIGLIIIIGTLFSIFTRKYAGIAIGTAIFAFQYIFFWLPANWVSNIALLSIFGVGALIYIRESENKIQ
jgi:hypothetical protein